jgi:hypothetical protein
MEIGLASRRRGRSRTTLNRPALAAAAHARLRDAIVDQLHAEVDVIVKRFIPGAVKNNSLEISAFWHSFPSAVSWTSALF